MNLYNDEIFSLAPSRSMEFIAKAKLMQKSDPSVISLAGGEPDFATPSPICEEAVKWLRAGYTHYTICPGLPELRVGIAEKLKRDNNCNYDPDGIIVAPGGKFAIYLAIRALVNKGDEVMYLEPGWVSYPAIIQASGATPVPVRLSQVDSFKLTREKLESAVTPNTKILIVNYPNNPTGKCLSQGELDDLVAFLEAHPQVLLMSDEIYERIVFTGFSNLSPASIPQIASRVITINGFSKATAMTGWRCGYLATSPEIAKVIYKLYQHTISCVSGFIQKAAVVALGCTEEIEQMRKRFEARRDLFINGMNSIPGVSAEMPEGAFYAWVKFDWNSMNSEEVCNLILEKARVVGVPGIAYGTDEPYVRFSFAESDEILAETVRRIKEVSPVK